MTLFINLNSSKNPLKILQIKGLLLPLWREASMLDLHSGHKKIRKANISQPYNKKFLSVPASLDRDFQFYKVGFLFSQDIEVESVHSSSVLSADI